MDAFWDCGGGSHSHRGRRRLLALTPFPVVFAVIVVATIIGILYGGTLERMQYQINSAELAGSPFVARSGGKLVINYKAKGSVQYARQCPTNVDVTIARFNDGVIVWRHRGIAPNVSTDWLAEVNVPALPVGAYHYNTMFRTACAEHRVFTSPAPAVRFEVR